MTEEEIINWAKKMGYKGSTFEGVDDFAFSIGMCLIFDPEENHYHVEPWNE